MGRHALRRGGSTALVSALAVAVAAATITLFSGTPDGGGAAQAATTTATAAAGTTEIVLDDPQLDTPRSDRLLAAGETGFLHRQAGVAGLLWTDYDDGTTVTVEGPSGVYKPTTTTCYDISVRCASGMYGQAGDTVALPHATYGDPVSLWTPDGSALRTVDLSQSADYVGMYGNTLVTVEWNGVVDAEQLDGHWLHLVDLVDGKQRDRVVTGYPTGGSWNRSTPRTGDENGFLLAYAVNDENGDVDSYTVSYLDFATAQFTEVFTGLQSEPELVLTDDRVGWYTASAGLHLKPRADLTAEETVPVAAGATTGGYPTLVGHWLVLTASGGVTAVSLTDGSARTLLTRAYGTPLATPDGAALVTGGTSASDWWIQRVTPGADGVPQLEKLFKVAPYENTKTGLALSRGSLRVAEDDPSSASDTTSWRTIDNVGGRLTATTATESGSISPKCPYIGTTCSAMWGNLGNGPRDVYLDTYDDGDEGGSGLSNADRLVAIGANPLEFHTEKGAIVDVSDNYAVYNSGGSTPMQYVGEFGQGQRLKRSIRAAALNGPTLWSATTTAGQLTSYSLITDKTLATVTVPGLACVPSELQAAGRWVYWACGTNSAGVYDSKAGTSRSVTPGDVLLGDGFTVRHDHATDQLVLTEAATSTTRVIASGVPDTGLAADRRNRWTVDEYTGLVAWIGAYEQTHVARTGVAPSTVTSFETHAPSYVDPNTPFVGSWLLSRPVNSWSVTFTSVQSGATGRATDTVTGAGAKAWVGTNWYGKAVGGSYFPTGQFTWTLKATGTGTSTPVTVATGKGFLSRGAAVRHDFVSPDGPDGRGDLLTLNSSGGLTFHSGTGTGKFNSKYTGTGWATTITAIPFGDLNGDRCNDVLVRYSSGALRLYKPGCGKAVTPSTSYTTLATSGWTQYNALTSPGDVSGDGRPDLIARGASTGTVYLYKGTSDGKLASRVKLYDNWKGYKKIVGVGDITGDGKADLLAQDTANTLYRYDGKGDGTFAARVKLFTDWGGSYNVVVGVGDITDDGKADLVSRDTSGNLYRNSGDGKGSFGSRTKIATGWSGYKFLG
ncbi:FG-GAP repeat domain-containing protein [Streptomyces sp. R41]|uniref:FG-GAP repeat domain-containing protein n=1 Tax=Streptomyces sp. R41 TaxID=3238632 RepID=A0AB39RP14_9ACTN